MVRDEKGESREKGREKRRGKRVEKEEKMDSSKRLGADEQSFTPFYRVAGLFERPPVGYDTSSRRF